MAFDGISIYEGKESYIFMSYAHDDAERVTPIMRELSDRGCRLWYDGGIVPSARWLGVITEHIENAAIFMVFATKRSMRSKEVVKETTYAINLGMTLMMICLDALKNSDIDPNIRMAFVIDQRVDGVGRSAKDIVDGIAGQIETTRESVKKPPAPVTPTVTQTVTEPVTDTASEFTFGTYKGEPILWQRLGIIDGRTLAITKYCIDNLPFDNSGAGALWSESSLRRWLNGEFFEEAFTRREQWRIYPRRNENIGNHYYETEDDVPTEDYVFCLSLAEADGYFDSEQERRTTATKHALERGALKGGAWWWLRTQGSSDANAAVVTHQGKLSYVGSDAGDEDVSVRPVIMLDK